MLYLKLMSGQNLADADPCKNYEIIPVPVTTDIRFVTAEIDNGPQAPRGTVVSVVLWDDGNGSRREITLSGNAYVMNEQGKTIASHSPY
jgi:hypothetical protein